jgi:hypothetical protein
MRTCGISREDDHFDSILNTINHFAEIAMRIDKYNL